MTGVPDLDEAQLSALRMLPSITDIATFPLLMDLGDLQRGGLADFDDTLGWYRTPEGERVLAVLDTDRGETADELLDQVVRLRGQVDELAEIADQALEVADEAALQLEPYVHSSPLVVDVDALRHRAERATKDPT